MRRGSESLGICIWSNDTDDWGPANFCSVLLLKSLPFPQEEQAGSSALLLRGEQPAAPADRFGVSSALFSSSSAAAAVVQQSFRGGRPPISKSGRNRGSNLVTRDEKWCTACLLSTTKTSQTQNNGRGPRVTQSSYETFRAQGCYDKLIQMPRAHLVGQKRGIHRHDRVSMRIRYAIH